jgi:hypothetical protein
MKLLAFLSFAVFVCFSAVSVQAEVFENENDKFEVYGKVEGWTIYINHTKKTCLIESRDEFDNAVQMGVSSDRKVAYIGVFTKAKLDPANGDESPIAILLGDKIYVGKVTDMSGKLTQDYSGGYVQTDDPEIVDAIAKQYTMTVFPKKVYAFTVNLKGTFKAIESARECLAKQSK